jgi:hypothetical protein
LHRALPTSIRRKSSTATCGAPIFLWTMSGMRASQTLGWRSSRTPQWRHTLRTAVGLCGG